MTVNRIVGRVEVQHQLPGRSRERGNELLHQLLMDRNRPLPFGPAVESAQRRGTRQHLVTTTCGLHHQVVAKGVVVVQILVPQRHREHALAHHRCHLVTDLATLAKVTEPTHHPGT